MADTKIINLPTLVATLASGDRFVVADVSASTTDSYCTPTQIQTFACNAPVFAAGTASANTWPKFTSGTILTTAEDGAIELDADCFYGCTDAGNRGIIPVQHFIRADSSRNLTASTAQQAIFNSPAAGKLTLETGCYRFEGLIAFTAMSTGSGNTMLTIVGSTTATCGSFLWHAWGFDTSTPSTPGAQTGSQLVTTSSGVAVISAATGSAMYCSFQGSFEVTAAGNIIPSVKLPVAKAVTLAAGAYFTIWRIGSTTVASVGQWT